MSHHPPVTAVYCEGKNYRYSTCQATNTSFNGSMLKITHQYRVYITLTQFDETYEIILPVLSAHNLVIGNLYLDIGETMHVTNLNRPEEKCEVKFERRGWFSKDKDAYKFAGDVFRQQGKDKKVKLFQINGNWNRGASYTDLQTHQTVEVWRKSAYPDNSDHMYGMNRYHIQMNYFPKRLHDVVAPTDTRRRQDQRALENGDMKTATYEKDRLENRQRTFRKYRAALGQSHEPRYFVKYKNEHHEGKEYWRYNNLYFEKDRAEQDWSQLPDIFGYEFPKEVQPYIVGDKATKPQAETK